MQHASSVSKLQHALKMRGLASCVVQKFLGIRQCDKQKSAIGDHDVFECPMGNRTPQELTPYVFNWGYEDATLKSHYLQAAAAVVKNLFRETHKSYPQTLTNLLWEVSARPLGSCRDKDDPDSEIKVVLSPIPK